MNLVEYPADPRDLSAASLGEIAVCMYVCKHLPTHLSIQTEMEIDQGQEPSDYVLNGN